MIEINPTQWVHSYEEWCEAYQERLPDANESRVLIEILRSLAALPEPDRTQTIICLVVGAIRLCRTSGDPLAVGDVWIEEALSAAQESETVRQ